MFFVVKYFLKIFSYLPTKAIPISKDILNAEKKANIMYLLKFGKTKDRASARSSKRRFALSCERIEKNNS